MFIINVFLLVVFDISEYFSCNLEQVSLTIPKFHQKRSIPSKDVWFIETKPCLAYSGRQRQKSLCVSIYSSTRYNIPRVNSCFPSNGFANSFQVVNYNISWRLPSYNFLSFAQHPYLYSGYFMSNKLRSNRRYNSASQF